MIDLRDKVISFIKKTGPVLPVQISKHIGMDLLLSGAVLSELVARKLVKVSRASIGSSPVYYLPNQEYLLGPKLYNHLKSKEREAYDLLREKRVIRAEKAEPWQRIAFSQLNDFAFPLYVTLKDKTEIFWRFYLTSEEDAKKLIEEMLQPYKREKPKEEVPEQIRLTEVEKPEPVKEEIPDKIKEEIIEKLKEPKVRKIRKKQEKIDFYDLIKNFLSKNKINVLQEIIIRKNKEYEFLVELPSSIGNLKYFIKARNKKSINEAEIILTHNQGQEKKMSSILLTNGNPTKKAKELIEKKISGQLIFKQI